MKTSNKYLKQVKQIKANKHQTPNTPTNTQKANKQANNLIIPTNNQHSIHQNNPKQRITP